MSSRALLIKFTLTDPLQSLYGYSKVVIVETIPGERCIRACAEAILGIAGVSGERSRALYHDPRACGPAAHAAAANV